MLLRALCQSVERLELPGRSVLLAVSNASTLSMHGSVGRVATRIALNSSSWSRFTSPPYWQYTVRGCTSRTTASIGVITSVKVSVSMRWSGNRRKRTSWIPRTSAARRDCSSMSSSRPS